MILLILTLLYFMLRVRFVKRRLYKVTQKFSEDIPRKVYEKCKPGMLKRFGRILSYEEFVQTLAYAHEKGLDK